MDPRENCLPFGPTPQVARESTCTQSKEPCPDMSESWGLIQQPLDITACRHTASALQGRGAHTPPTRGVGWGTVHTSSRREMASGWARGRLS